MTGAEIAAAFMQQNDKRTWKARSVNRARNTVAGDVVHFESTGGMVSLMYYVESGQFAVKFNKFHGAWGDYVKAIARSLFVVLNTLKSAGLPFDAPATLAGMVIECTTTDDNLTRVRWPGAGTALVDNQTLAVGYPVPAASEPLRNHVQCCYCGSWHDRRMACPPVDNEGSNVVPQLPDVL
jgi:hypothetical protein